MAELFLLQERTQPAPPWLSSGDVLRLRRHGSHLGRPQVGAFHTCHSRARLGSAGMAEKGICSRLPSGAWGPAAMPQGDHPAATSGWERRCGMEQADFGGIDESVRAERSVTSNGFLQQISQHACRRATHPFISLP